MTDKWTKTLNGDLDMTLVTITDATVADPDKFELAEGHIVKVDGCEARNVAKAFGYIGRSACVLNNGLVFVVGDSIFQRISTIMQEPHRCNAGDVGTFVSGLLEANLGQVTLNLFPEKPKGGRLYSVDRLLLQRTSKALCWDVRGEYLFCPGNPPPFKKLYVDMDGLTEEEAEWEAFIIAALCGET